MSSRGECNFSFDYETSVVHLSGQYQMISVFVYGDRDFEAIDIDLCARVNISSLPHIDQAAIHQQIAAGLKKQDIARAYSLRECGHSESGAEILELNQVRGR